MAWRVDIGPRVKEVVNGLLSSGALSRRGLLRFYNALRLDLPRSVRRFRDDRYANDPDYFRFRVGFHDRGVWRRLLFYVNDSVEPGLLLVEDVDDESDLE